MFTLSTISVRRHPTQLLTQASGTALLISSLFFPTVTHADAGDPPEFEVEVDIHTGAQKAVEELAAQWSKSQASSEAPSATTDCREWAFSVSGKAIAWASIQSGLIEFGRDFARAIGDAGKMANMKGLEKASKLAGGVIDSMLSEDPYQQLAHAVAEAAGDFLGGQAGERGAEKLTHGRVGEGAGETGEQLGKKLAKSLFPASPKSNTFKPLIDPWGTTVTYDFEWPVGAKRGGLRITIHGDCHGKFPPNQPEAARLGEFQVAAFLPLEGIEASAERERDPANIKGLVEALFDVGHPKKMDISSGPTAAFLATNTQFTLKFTPKWGKFSQDDVNVYAPCVGSLPKTAPAPPLEGGPSDGTSKRPIVDCDQRCSREWKSMSDAHLAFWEAEQKANGLGTEADKAKRELTDAESALDGAEGKAKLAEQHFRDRIITAEKDLARARSSGTADSAKAVDLYSQIIKEIEAEQDRYMRESRAELQKLRRRVETARTEFGMMDKLATQARIAAKATELTYAGAKLAYGECVKRCHEAARQAGERALRIKETLKAADGLGRVWKVTEALGWQGTWTRRPDSTTFDAHWENGPYTSDEVIELESVDGGKVVLFRPRLNGRYTGTLSQDRRGVTSGTADWYKPGWAPWSATFE